MDSRSTTVSSPPRPPAGGSRGVLEAALAAMQQHAAATLALVMDTEGSTYVRPGAMALFGGGEAQVGWLSGGGLEPEIAARAEVASREARIEWMDVDTRDDEDLLVSVAPEEGQHAPIVGVEELQAASSECQVTLAQDD